MYRIYRPEHEYEAGSNSHGYLSRVIEMDAREVATQNLLDLSQINLINRNEIRDYALYSMPFPKSPKDRKYPNHNSMIKQMFELIQNYGLSQSLSKNIYENMQILGLTKSKYLVYAPTKDGETTGKIDYVKTVYNNYEHIHSIGLQLALAKETSLREKYFPTLFNPDSVIFPYAERSNTTVNQYKQDLLDRMMPEEKQIYESSKEVCMYEQ
jgi:hypothetical protein